MINRRMLVLASGALLTPLAARAQQAGKVYRVAYVGFTAAKAPGEERNYSAFVQRLRELGFAEGRNLVIEWRFAEGKAERNTDFAAEMVRLKADVVVTSSSGAVRAVMAASRSLPIVTVGLPDPVRSGLVASLARPGGQLTGIANFSDELMPKRLELTKAALPAARRIAFAESPSGLLTSHRSAAVVSAVHAAEDAAARSLGVKLLRLDVTTADDFDKAATALRRERPDALLTAANTINFAMRREWSGLAAELRLPLFAPIRQSDAMFSYGPDYVASMRKVAEYVAKILNGANPGDLPMEQAMKFEFVINLKMAKAFGITIPRTVLLRADEVIE